VHFSCETTINDPQTRETLMKIVLQPLFPKMMLTFALAAAMAAPAQAAELPADVASKVAAVTKQLVQLAADPAIVSAAKEANGRDAGSMNNGKWADIADADPAVKAIISGKVGAQIAKWEAANDAVNKLVLRDQKGNVVGASAKPLLFNNASRPQFANAMKGQPWAAAEVKSDPTTQIPSVQVGVPVMDGGKAIGVLHAGVTAK
jgi:hypothetical protein